MLEQLNRLKREFQARRAELRQIKDKVGQIAARIFSLQSDAHEFEAIYRQSPWIMISSANPKEFFDYHCQGRMTPKPYIVNINGNYCSEIDLSHPFFENCKILTVEVNGVDLQRQYGHPPQPVKILNKNKYFAQATLRKEQHPVYSDGKIYSLNNREICTRTTGSGDNFEITN